MIFKKCKQQYLNDFDVYANLFFAFMVNANKCIKMNLKFVFALSVVEWGNLMIIYGKDEECGSLELANYLNYYIYTSHTLMITMYILLL